jgi:heptosyltransferase II
VKAGIVVFVPNWLGDCVMALPALYWLREHHANKKIVAVAKPSVAPLLMSAQCFDEVRILPQGFRMQRSWARAQSDLRGFSAIVMPNSFRAALIAKLLGVSEAAGFRGQRFRSLLLSAVIDRQDRQHQSLCYAALVGAPDTMPIPTQVLIPSKVERDRWKKQISEHQPIVAIIPGAARGPSKQWPLDRFAVLAKVLSAEGYATVVVGSKTERAMTEAMNSIPGLVNLCGESSLQDLPNLLAATDVVVSNDSGGMHVAAAVGTPLVCLFGTTDPDETGPLGDKAIILQKSSYRSRAVARECPRAIAAMAEISVDEVMEAVHLQLAAFVSSRE